MHSHIQQHFSLQFFYYIYVVVVVVVVVIFVLVAAFVVVVLATNLFCLLSLGALLRYCLFAGNFYNGVGFVELCLAYFSLLCCSVFAFGSISGSGSGSHSFHSCLPNSTIVNHSSCLCKQSLSNDSVSSANRLTHTHLVNKVV